jgi:formate hydrogenlyase subunit 4
MLTTIILGISVAMMIAIVVFLVGVMLRSIRNERRSTGTRKVWANFGLSLVLCLLFFSSWVAQAMSQWQQFRAEQRTHGEPPEIAEFLAEFSSATLENWQSEFLQLFSFVVLAALFIHRGSAESKDSDDRMEESLQRIERMLQERQG